MVGGIEDYRKDIKPLIHDLIDRKNAMAGKINCYGNLSSVVHGLDYLQHTINLSNPLMNSGNLQFFKNDKILFEEIKDSIPQEMRIDIEMCIEFFDSIFLMIELIK